MYQFNVGYSQHFIDFSVFLNLPTLLPLPPTYPPPPRLLSYRLTIKYNFLGIPQAPKHHVRRQKAGKAPRPASQPKTREAETSPSTATGPIHIQGSSAPPSPNEKTLVLLQNSISAVTKQAQHAKRKLLIHRHAYPPHPLVTTL